MSVAGEGIKRVHRFSAQGHKLALAMSGVSAAGLVYKVVTDDLIGTPIKIGVFIVLLAMLGLLVAWALRTATIVTENGITIRRLRGTTTIAWPDVQEIHAELNPARAMKSSAPKALVAVYDRRGDRWPLPNVTEANLASQGMDIAREVAAMREAWQRLRGPDWVSAPAVQNAVARRDRLLLAFWVGFTAFMVAMPLTLAVFFVLSLTGVIGPLERFLGGQVPPLLVMAVPVTVGLAAALLSARSSARKQRG